MTLDERKAGRIRAIGSDTDRVSVLGRCRGHALSAGSMALILATSDDAGERAAATEELSQCIRLYHEGIAQGLADPCPAALTRGAGAELRTLHDFAACLPAADGAEVIAREAATVMAWKARREVLPALYTVIEILMAEEARAEEATVARIAERNERLEAMFTEMERIGRTIKLVSLNAAVEAARTGGESGRAFGVIATEVRALATRASEILSQTRAHVTDRTRPTR